MAKRHGRRRQGEAVAPDAEGDGAHQHRRAQEAHGIERHRMDVLHGQRAKRERSGNQRRKQQHGEMGEQSLARLRKSRIGHETAMTIRKAPTKAALVMTELRCGVRSSPL